MAKIDKTNLSKKEAKEAIAAKKRAKEEKAIREKRILSSPSKPKENTKKKTIVNHKETPRAVPFDPNTVADKKYILCIKHGDKYDHEYVNRLYNMCKRHTTVDFEFVCLTSILQGNPKYLQT